MIRHRKCAATDARNAGSLCPSSVLLGVSLARRLAVRNLLVRVAARLPALGVACTACGGSQAACVCRGSSFSTRRRSAAIIISICLDSRHWLSLLVCVPLQVIYGFSAVSRHFGDVVLWELNPPAAGEVLIRAGGHPRLLCGSWGLMIVHDMHTTRATTFGPRISQRHNTRSDLDAGADGCAEGGGSRPGAGGVILWERALLAEGRKISLGEPAGPRRKTRKGDLMRRQTRMCCPPAAAARPPWPQAATAALKW